MDFPRESWVRLLGICGSAGVRLVGVVVDTPLAGRFGNAQAEPLDLGSTELLTDLFDEFSADPAGKILGGGVVHGEDADFVRRNHVAAFPIRDVGMPVVSRLHLEFGMLAGQDPALVERVT